MVFYKPQQRRGTRRIGQANQAQAMLQPQALNQQAMLQPQALNQQLGLNNPDALALEQASGMQVLPDTLTVDQVEAATNFGIAAGPTQEGGDAMLISLNNGQELVTIEQVPQAAAAAPQAQCEFPAQDVLLQRTVNITNTPPQLVNVETDICGNTVAYSEQMTRRLAAGPWVPISGLQGNVDNFANVNGVVQSVEFGGNVNLANSPGLQGIVPQPQVVSQQLVGGKRQVFPSSNRAYGVAAMRKFRSA